MTIPCNGRYVHTSPTDRGAVEYQWRPGVPMLTVSVDVLLFTGHTPPRRVRSCVLVVRNEDGTWSTIDESASGYVVPAPSRTWQVVCPDGDRYDTWIMRVAVDNRCTLCTAGTCAQRVEYRPGGRLMVIHGAYQYLD